MVVAAAASDIVEGGDDGRGHPGAGGRQAVAMSRVRVDGQAAHTRAYDGQRGVRQGRAHRHRGGVAVKVGRRPDPCDLDARFFTY